MGAAGMKTTIGHMVAAPSKASNAVEAGKKET